VAIDEVRDEVVRKLKSNKEKTRSLVREGGAKLKNVIKQIEKKESRELNYSTLTYDEFYYRLSVRDKFIMQILNSDHRVVVDKDNILNKG
jgi:hypothetical protein